MCIGQQCLLIPPSFRLHVVFGHVVSGMQYVTEMENQKVDANHRPYADVRISSCGELVLVRGMSCNVQVEISQLLL